MRRWDAFALAKSILPRSICLIYCVESAGVAVDLKGELNDGVECDFELEECS